MITIYYNNITIENALTRAFRQEVVYDPSGTDHFFSRYTMTFEGLITGLGRGQRITCSLSQDAAAAWGAPHPIWADIRHALMDPRYPLTITARFANADGQIEERTIFRCVPERLAPEDPDRDLGHGPKPTELEIIGMIGGRALKVRWSVQCEKLDFPKDSYGEVGLHFEEGTAGLQTVLDNRWSVSEELDENFYLTRTIRGSLRLSRPVARAGWDYRWLTVPALEAGFKRTRMSYAVKEDGLSADYEVIDRQVHTAAPWPATSMRVSNQKSTRMGTHYVGTCRVELVGPPHIPRKALVIRAVQIIDELTRFITSKGLFNDPKGNLNFIPVNISVTEEIGDRNAVITELQYEFSPGNGLNANEEQFVNHFKQLGEDLTLSRQPWPIPGLGPPPFDHYDPNLSWMPSPYGYTTWGEERSPAAVAIFQCYLQRPYHPWHATGWWPAPAGAPEEIIRPETQQTEVQRVEPGELVVPETEKKFSQSHAQALYTYSRMVSIYKIHRRRLAFDYLAAKDDGPSTVVVSLGPSSARRLIIIDAERYGRPPELPSPVDYTDANGVKGYLLKYDVELLPRSVSPGGDGWIYRARARYVYALDRAPPEVDAAPWPVGRLPHTADPEPGWQPQESFSERVGPNPSFEGAS